MAADFTTVTFWRDTAERAVRTTAQAALAAITAGATGILDVDFAGVGSVAGLAAVTSVLMSLAGRGVGDPGTGSLIK